MGLEDFIVDTAILEGGPAVGKSDVIQQLLLCLAKGQHIAESDVPSLYEAVMKREALATTGIGSGVAIPHARHASVSRYQVLLATCRRPVEFESVDAEPADILVLCLAPRDDAMRSTKEMSKQAERLMRRLANEEFRSRLRQATTPEEVMDVVKQPDRDFG